MDASHVRVTRALHPLARNPRLDMTQIPANGEDIPCLVTHTIEKSQLWVFVVRMTSNTTHPHSDLATILPNNDDDVH